MNEKRLGSLLEREDSRALPAETRAVLASFVGGDKVVGDFAYETSKGELANEEVGGLLVLADLTERDGAWFEAGSLGCRGGRERYEWTHGTVLASCRLAPCLLGPTLEQASACEVCGYHVHVARVW